MKQRSDQRLDRDCEGGAIGRSDLHRSDSTRFGRSSTAQRQDPVVEEDRSRPRARAPRQDLAIRSLSILRALRSTGSAAATRAAARSASASTTGRLRGDHCADTRDPRRSALFETTQRTGGHWPRGRCSVRATLRRTSDRDQSRTRRVTASGLGDRAANAPTRNVGARRSSEQEARKL